MSVRDLIKRFERQPSPHPTESDAPAAPANPAAVRPESPPGVDTTVAEPPQFAQWLREQPDLRFSEQLLARQDALATATPTGPGTLLGVHRLGMDLLQRFLIVCGKIEAGVRPVTLNDILLATSLPEAESSSQPPPDKGVWWIVKEVVEPATAARQCSLLDLLKGWTCRRGQEDYPLVGAATHFHSYTWGASMGQTMDVLTNWLNGAEAKTSSPTPAYVWWDIFCQNQHVKGDVAGTFRAGIEQVGTFLFSLPDCANPAPLSRVWCLYEICSAFFRKQQDEANPGARGRRLRVEFVTVPFSKVTLDPRQVDIDVLQAQTKFEEDKTMLLAKIEEEIPGGVQGLNRMLQQRFRELALASQLLAVAEGPCVDGAAAVQQLAADYPDIGVNAADAGGQTALHKAAFRGDYQLVEQLVELGADIERQDLRGFRPRDIAHQEMHMHLEEFLGHADPAHVRALILGS
eukprot:m.25101 g.25101  ORF g.25101 m.25101 type:complete len:461 (+) comp4388_c0_seq1:550-1932(+)